MDQDQKEYRSRCLVCGRRNWSVTMSINAGTEWEDCGHSTADLLRIGFRSDLTPEQMFPIVADVARRALGA